MGKVIQFPNSNTDPAFVKSEQERLQNVRKYQIDLCLDMSIDLTYVLLDQIQQRGIELNSDDIDQHLLMVSESIKSLLLKASDIRHPLQDITTQIVNKEESHVFKTRWLETLSPEEH